MDQGGGTVTYVGHQICSSIALITDIGGKGQDSTSRLIRTMTISMLVIITTTNTIIMVVKHILS